MNSPHDNQTQKETKQYLQAVINSVIVPLSKSGDDVAMCRRKGRVDNRSSLSTLDFGEVAILSWKS